MRKRLVAAMVAEIERQRVTERPGSHISDPLGGEYLDGEYLIDGYIDMNELADAIINNLKELKEF